MHLFHHSFYFIYLPSFWWMENASILLSEAVVFHSVSEWNEEPRQVIT